MNDNDTHIEYLFLIRSIQEFCNDLSKLRELIKKKMLTEKESLETMGNLVAIKEAIEQLEKEYLEL